VDAERWRNWQGVREIGTDRGEVVDFVMWQQLGLVINDLENRPSREAVAAAAFRQLLRAQAAADRVAVWSATSAFYSRLRLILREFLSREPAWDSKGRCLEGFGLSSRILYHQADRVIQLADAMVWVSTDDTCGGQWAEPFKADMTMTADMDDLDSYTIQFGDRRKFPGEDFQSSLARIERELKNGLTEWAFVFRFQAAAA
jgi:hypothetical protein